jgi:(p)ppGpp synthase/HD superfamily hydrolase
MVANKTENVSNDDVPLSLDVRSRRAADRFARLPLAQAALRFAAARHANQSRETDHAPFIAHPIEVGQLLDRDGRSDEVIAAGLLHDLLEKTATTREELQCRFGVRIARLVESVSDDPSIDDYESRKRDLRDRVARGDSHTWAIFAADKISKVRELAQLPPRRLQETKARTELAHYRASLTMLRRVAGDLALVALLDAELDRLVARAVTEPRDDGATTSIGCAQRSKPRPRTI